MKKILNLITIAIIITLEGCQQAEMFNENTSETTKKQSIFAENFSVQNGMLIFKTEADFIATLQAVSKMNYSQYLDWCKTHNFVSLQKIFIDAMNAEADYNEYSEQMQQKNINYQKNEHSNLLQQNLSKNIIKEIKTPEGLPIYKLSTCREEYSLLLNENKMISINGDIYQYNDENIIKIIKNNDFSKISQIESINQSTSNGKIIIWKDDIKNDIKTISNECLYTYHYTHNIFYNYKSTFYSENNKRELRITVYSKTNQATKDGNYYLSFYADLTHYKNENINKPSCIKVLKNTIYQVIESTVQYPDNILNSTCYQYDQTYLKQPVVRHYFINGGYPRTLTNDIIHLPHIKNATTGFELKFYVEDKYWEPFHNVTVSTNAYCGLTPAPNSDPNGYLIK